MFDNHIAISWQLYKVIHTAHTANRWLALTSVTHWLVVGHQMNGRFWFICCNWGWFVYFFQGVCSTVKEGWWATSIRWTRWRQCLEWTAKGSCVGLASRSTRIPGSTASHVSGAKPTGPLPGTLTSISNTCVYRQGNSCGLGCQQRSLLFLSFVTSVVL